MEMDRRWTLIALFLGLLGTVFTTMGIWGMSPEVMANISRTYLNSNEHFVKSLASQKANLAVGLTLIFLAFLASLVSFVYKMQRHEIRCFAIITIGALVLGFLAFYVNHSFTRIFYEQTEKILKE